jgi:hypothetical protein
MNSVANLLRINPYEAEASDVLDLIEEATKAFKKAHDGELYTSSGVPIEIHMMTFLEEGKACFGGCLLASEGVEKFDGASDVASSVYFLSSLAACEDLFYQMSNKIKFPSIENRSRGSGSFVSPEETIEYMENLIELNRSI